MSHRKRARSAALWADLMLVPAVMAIRLPMLASEARESGAIRKETVRAFTEKAAAAGEGVVAAQLAVAKAACTFWPELLAGRVPSLLNGAAAQQAVDAALKPAGRRVRANFRRLSKLK